MKPFRSHTLEYHVNFPVLLALGIHYSVLSFSLFRD